MVSFGSCHRRIELNQNISRFDDLPIVNVNGAHDTRFKWLHQFDATAGDNLAGRKRNDVDVSKASPD